MWSMLSCVVTIEWRLYYSANFADVISVYCSVDLPSDKHDQDYLPQCEEYKDKPKTANKSKKCLCAATCCVRACVCIVCCVHHVLTVQLFVVCMYTGT